MPPSRLRFREIAFLCLSLVLPLQLSLAQTSERVHQVPIELRPADSETRALLDAARADSDAGNFEAALSKLKTALELTQSRGFVGDRAITEEAVAIGYFAMGNLDQAFKYYQSSWEDAVASSNLVLQADALVALAMLPQSQGKLQAASDLLTKAQKVPHHCWLKCK